MMRKMQTRATALAMTALLFTVPSAPSASAQDPNRDQIDEAAEESREAATAIRAVMDEPKKGIPLDMLEQAQAIAVFSNVVQAAFLVGGRGGDGAISRRTEDGWSVPAFFRLGGASLGAQIGGTRTDIVLLFMDEEALDALLDNRLELGADVEAVAGPVGRRAGATTTARFNEGILAYTRSKGLFAGASVEGAVITPNNGLNKGVYGADARAILTGAEIESPPTETRALPDALAEIVTGKS